MATYVLIHGAAESGSNWQLVARELRARGHVVIAPDLPCEDDEAGFAEYAAAVIAAIGGRTSPIIVGHSLGGYTATLVAESAAPAALILLSAMIPAPGEPAGQWWSNTGYSAPDRDARVADEPMSEADQYYHDVPQDLAIEDQRQSRGQSGTPMTVPWPLTRWPEVPTRFILCTKDRFFPPAFMRRVVADRLPGVVPDEIAAEHMPMLSRPVELAELLDGYARETDGVERAG